MHRLAFHNVRATAQLNPFIKAFHIITSEGRPANGVAGTHPPDAGLQLTINFGAELNIADHIIPTCSAFVSSPTERFDMVTALGHVDIFNVGFRPGGARPFLHCPLSQLQAGSHNLLEFWPREHVAALMQLEQLPPLNRKEAVEAVLLAQMDRQFAPIPDIQRAMQLVADHNGQLGVQQLADLVGLSRSYLFRAFKVQVGISPKVFIRIYRIQHAVAELMKDPNKPHFAQLAHEAGYFDQSHLIRDFVAFTGLAPSDFLKREQQATFVQYLLEHHE